MGEREQEQRRRKLNVIKKFIAFKLARCWLCAGVFGGGCVTERGWVMVKVMAFPLIPLKTLKKTVDNW